MRYLLGVCVFWASLAHSDDLEFITNAVMALDSKTEISATATDVLLVLDLDSVNVHHNAYHNAINAICEKPSAVKGLQTITVMNRHSVRGAQLWHFNESPDLVSVCERINAGAVVQQFSVAM